MRNLALAFGFSALLAAGFVACGDDSSASAVDTPSSESALLSSSSDVDSSSSTQISSESKTFSSSVENEARSSSDALSSGKQSGSSESAPVSSSSVVSEGSSSSEALASSDDNDSDDGKCTDCDSYTAADPELTENGGKGSVTTYGSITAKETSLGGACNYGQTNIQYYAAIHVNVSPGDEKGPWNGGAACGGCVRVKAKTPDGWKHVTVRITDRCPDADCGVDLGGAPAADIMGNQVGRYYGEWEFVSCEGVDGVWGDSTSLWVKEGASEFWSIIQVRNPKDMVKSIAIYGVDTRDFYELEMVVGTENFWTVPEAVLKTGNRYRVVVTYRTGTDDEWKIKGSDLAVPEANLYLYEHRE
ncbi:hypothetical protein [Fibrobacter sp.]|uniref:hypothetical protein n=1 Tax=Fibrobacter sp. TaxID=35828 RepID=UPI003890D74D